MYHVPAGSVISYGGLAGLAGNASLARQVGQLAHYGDSQLPWHRLIHSDGSLAEGFPGGTSRQSFQLEAEGIRLENQRVAKKYFTRGLPRWLSGKIVVIGGETGSGKSSLAIDIAKKYNGSIISADSWAVRRRMDIGTAKPSKSEQQEIDHYGIDLVEVDGDFSAAAYQRIAFEAIENIQAHGKLPIIVGGTGLYIDSVIYSYSFLKNIDKVYRVELDGKSLSELHQIAHDKLIDLEKIDSQNKRRLVRAIENQGEQSLCAPNLRPDTLYLALTHDKDTLRQRLTQRTNQMIEHGLRTEAEHLSRHYGWSVEAMKGIGYAEWRNYPDISETEVAKMITQNCMKLAKRQRTWFGKNKDVHWCERDKAKDLVEGFINSAV